MPEAWQTAVKSRLLLGDVMSMPPDFSLCKMTLNDH
jgi:hypothetical protein